MYQPVSRQLKTCVGTSASRIHVICEREPDEPSFYAECFNDKILWWEPHVVVFTRKVDAGSGKEFKASLGPREQYHNKKTLWIKRGSFLAIF